MIIECKDGALGPGADALGGWTNDDDSEGTTTYGSGFSARVLAAEIDKIAVPGLDLSHLTPRD